MARDKLILIRDFILACYALDLLKQDQRMLEARFGARVVEEDRSRLGQIIKDIKSELEAERVEGIRQVIDDARQTVSLKPVAAFHLSAITGRIICPLPVHRSRLRKQKVTLWTY